MSPPARRRSIALAAVAAAALLAALYADPAREIVQPDARAHVSAAESRAGAAVDASPESAVAMDPDLARAQRRFDPPDRSGSIEDLFAPRSWARPEAQPAPPPPVAGPEAPPAAPTAPPLPYKYLGQLREPGRTVVFLARGDDPVMAETGQVIDGDYRVERISETEVEFTYLPLATRQILSASPVQ